MQSVISLSHPVIIFGTLIFIKRNSGKTDDSENIFLNTLSFLILHLGFIFWIPACAGMTLKLSGNDVKVKRE